MQSIREIDEHGLVQVVGREHDIGKSDDPGTSDHAVSSGTAEW